MTARGPLRGRDRTAESLRRAFWAGGRPTQALRFERVEARPLGADHALVTGRFVLAGGEAIGPGCDDNASATFMTLDAATLSVLSEFRMSTGAGADGRAPATTWCTHWFSPHPTFANGGMVAIAWYEHGTRFLKVSPKGQIDEVGWFIPVGTSASAAYWVNKDVLYLIDYQRGLDIVKFHDKPVPRPARKGTGLPPTKAPLFPAVMKPSVDGKFCPVPVA
jgi:hypothetical protein